MPNTGARVRFAGDDSGSDAERPPKKQRPESAGSSTGDEEDEHVVETQSPLDITAAVLSGGVEALGGALPRSAFSFSPAKPPAAYASSRPGLEVLRNAPPSTASSRRWTANALQRYADSFAFHSRDRLETRAELPDSFADIDDIQRAIRIDTFEKTGALIWVQVKCLDQEGRGDGDDAFSMGRTFGHTYLDASGRQRGQERLLNSDGPRDDILPSADDDGSSAVSQLSFQHSHLGLSRYRHEPDRSNPHYDVVLYDFQEEDPEPELEARGLYRSQFVEPEEDDYACTLEGGWVVYDKPVLESTLSVPVRPLVPGDACSEILEGFDRVKPDKGRGDELNLTITITGDDHDIWYLSAVNLAPLGLSYLNIPLPDDHDFAAIAVNEDTGYCWFGHLDGSIEYLDILEWIDDNMLTCPRFEDENDEEGHEGYCPCNVDAISPRQVVAPNKGRGAVTNLVAVGRDEAVAAFFKGSMMLLRKRVAQGGKITIAKAGKFFGHVNEGSQYIEMAVHTPSRLVAARGTDGRVRVWHLDSSYPLNTPWHRPRGSQPLYLDLLPKAPSQPEELLEGSKTQGPSSTTDPAPAAQDDNTWDRLATQKVEEADFAHVKDSRFADIRAHRFCSMAWTPTSWLADRDGQWEMSRDFDATGRPKVVSAGLLPSLVCCSDRSKGTTFLYFEQQKRVGVEDAELVEIEGEEEEAKEEDAPMVYEAVEDLD